MLISLIEIINEVKEAAKLRKALEADQLQQSNSRESHDDPQRALIEKKNNNFISKDRKPQAKIQTRRQQDYAMVELEEGVSPLHPIASRRTLEAQSADRRTEVKALGKNSL